jgi:hypothetical protein
MSTPSPAIRARGAIKAAGGLLGAKETAARLSVLVTNVGAVRGLEPLPDPPASGPVYLGCEVDEALERLERARARRAASA